MRLSLGVSAFAALAAAIPAPVPQEIEIDLLLAVPEPTVTQAIGVAAQTVSYDAESLAAQATAAATSISIAVSDVASATAIERRDACAPQLTGVTQSGYAVTATDNPSAFLANPAFAAAATDSIRLYKCFSEPERVQQCLRLHGFRQSRQLRYRALCFEV